MDYFVYSFQFTAVGMEKKKTGQLESMYCILEQVAFLSHCSFINYAGAKIATAGERAWKLLPANGHEFLTKFLGEGGGG